MEYGRDAYGHEIGEYPRVRTIATRPVDRRDVVPDCQLAVVVLVQSGDEHLYVYNLEPRFLVAYYKLQFVQLTGLVRTTETLSFYG